MSEAYESMIEEYMDVAMKVSRVIRKKENGETEVDDSLFSPDMHPVYTSFAKYFATVETIGTSLMDVLGWWPNSSVGQFNLDTRVRHEESACYADIVGTFSIPCMGLGKETWFRLIADIWTDQQLVQPIHVVALTDSSSDVSDKKRMAFTDYKQLHAASTRIEEMWLLPVELRNAIEPVYREMGSPEPWCEISCFPFEDRILLRWFMTDIPLYTHEGRTACLLASACQNKLRKLKEHTHIGVLTRRKEIILDNLQYEAFKSSKVYTEAAHKYLNEIEQRIDERARARRVHK